MKKNANKFLNQFLKILILMSIVLIYSCSPQSKESYLEDYKDFMNDISNENNEYTEEDWIEMDEEYEQYSDEYYEQFKEDITLQEQFTLANYSIQYKLLRYQKYSLELMNVFNKKNYDMLKAQIKYYSDNKMDEDIQNLVKLANEIGNESSKALEDILNELDINVYE